MPATTPWPSARPLPPAHAVAAPDPPAAAGTAVLIDSGPLLALFNAADRWHQPVRQWLQANPAVRLVSTWPVLTEVCALLARRIHNGAALDLLRWVQRGAVEIDRPDDTSLAEVLAISQRFASLPFDLADASVAEAAQRRRIRRVLSIDADFDVYRDKAGKPLRNLLRP
ncbi:MAG: type II toxin-antitoxin system VapC family toxin [Burkholderiaceae bacterium]|nr:type II toxin-antitoxin system VapC family toxin [Burkholderiaceae bacterium]